MHYLAAAIAAAAVIVTAAIATAVAAAITAAAVQTAAAKQENQNNDDPKTIVAISAEHKRNLSPHGKFYTVAVPIVREWKRCAFVMFG